MKDRIIEMLERKERVSLECIDPDGFDSENPINKFILKLDNIIIKKAILGWVGCRDKFVVDAPIEEMEGSSLNENSFIIFEDDLKYFKIKEPEYTFNDLIDVAVQAAKDGILHVREITSDSLRFSKVDGLRGNSYYYRSSKYLGGIEHIKSLYYETFIIESEEDMCRISGGCEIVLTNGESIGSIVTISNGTPYFGLAPMPYAVLKGATVTQKRGNQCNK